MVSRDLPAPSLALRQLDMSLAHSIDALFDRVLDFKSRGLLGKGELFVSTFPPLPCNTTFLKTLLSSCELKVLEQVATSVCPSGV